jgi:hypothetical protein
MQKSTRSFRQSARKALSSLAIGALLLTSLGLATTAFAQTNSATSADAPKPNKKRGNVTIIKNGEVVYSSSDGKGGDWKSLEEAMGKEGDSIRTRIQSALKDAGKRVHISSTNNTMTIVVDKDGDGDSDRTFSMSFSGDDMERWGREFSRTFGRGINQFHFDTRPFQDMARQFHFAMPRAPRPPRAPQTPNVWRFDSDDFDSEKAEDLAEDANDLAREAEALRKEAEALRLEAEAMKKRSEALRLEADARKNKKSDDKKSDKSANKK